MPKWLDVLPLYPLTDLEECRHKAYKSKENQKDVEQHPCPVHARLLRPWIENSATWHNTCLDCARNSLNTPYDQLGAHNGHQNDVNEFGYFRIYKRGMNRRAKGDCRARPRIAAPAMRRTTPKPTSGRPCTSHGPPHQPTAVVRYADNDRTLRMNHLEFAVS